MRKLSFLVLALLVASCGDQPTAMLEAPPATVAASFARAQAPDFVAGRVLAQFRPGAQVATLAAAHGAVPAGVVGTGVQLLTVPSGKEVAVATALARNPNVVFAEPDFLHRLGDPAALPVNDPFIGYRWDLDNDGNIYDSQSNVIVSTGKVDADTDWREAVESAGPVSGSARIAILDSGIRSDHQEFAGVIASQWDFVGRDNTAEDQDGHGTHVAGIAAGRTDNAAGISGVAFAGDVDLAIGKVCGPAGCPSSAIANGIIWAVRLRGAHVINLSLGGPFGSSTVRSALQEARAKGVLPFCASGNDASAVSFPAAWPECVAVSATDWGDNLASYSNTGSEVELSAPGGDFENPSGYSYILSAWNSSPSSYAFLAGTSMATPHAAGLAALLHVIGVTDDDAKLDRMKNTADDLGPQGADNAFGVGRINIAAAMAGATPPPPPPPPPPSGGTIGESGNVAFEQQVGQWHQVTLTGAYQNPVVLFGPPSFAGVQPTTVRVRNVTGSSFEFQVDEWDYLDGFHLTEIISFVVLEAGTHTLTDGTIIEAGISTGVGSGWSTVGFSAAFGAAPVVVSQVASVNESSAVTTRQRSVGPTSFQLQVQEEEAGGSHAPETVHWLAVQAGAGSGREASRTGDQVTHDWTDVTFLGSYNGPPVFLAAMQTADGPNTATIRYRNLDGIGAEVFVEEEQSLDSEVSHITEVVGWVVFGNAGSIDAN